MKITEEMLDSLRNEIGLELTDNAREVVQIVLDQVGETDEAWDQHARRLPIPAPYIYAAAIISALKRKYPQTRMT